MKNTFKIMSIKIKKIKQGNPELIKIFLKRLLYIGLCLIPMFVFDGCKGNIRFVSLPFFLIGIYHLVRITPLSMYIIDGFISTNTRKFVEARWLVPTFMLVFFFLVGIIFLSARNKYYDNTIDVSKLTWMICAFGIGLAIPLSIIIRKFVYLDKGSFITLFVELFLLSSVLFGFINYHYADNKKDCKTYTIIQKKIGGAKTINYFIYVNFDDNTERNFSVGRKRYKSFNEGETVEICFKKGLFGFDFAADFNKTNNKSNSYQSRSDDTLLTVSFNLRK